MDISPREAVILNRVLPSAPYLGLTTEDVRELADEFGVVPERVWQIASRMSSGIRRSSAEAQRGLGTSKGSLCPGAVSASGTRQSRAKRSDGVTSPVHQPHTGLPNTHTEDYMDQGIGDKVVDNGLELDEDWLDPEGWACTPGCPDDACRASGTCNWSRRTTYDPGPE